MRLRSNPWHPCCIAETATKTTRDPNRLTVGIIRKNEIIGIDDKERQIKNIKILESPNPIVIRSTQRKNNLRRSLNNKIKNRSNPALDPLLRKLIPWIFKQMMLYKWLRIYFFRNIRTSQTLLLFFDGQENQERKEEKYRNWAPHGPKYQYL